MGGSQKIDAPGKQKWCVAIDYRKLNEFNVRHKYPLNNPLLDE